MAPLLRIGSSIALPFLLILCIFVPSSEAVPPEGPDIRFGSALFWIYVGLCALLTLFGGMCSGLSMGLLSQETLHLEVLSQSDNPTVAKHAAGILGLARRRHLVLVSLLLANSAAMETLPLFLDRLTLAYVAIIISVTVVLAFGEILPSAICTRYGLAIAYHMRYVVWLIVIISLPISWPIAKALDLMLGADHHTYYRRSELKHFVKAHAHPETAVAEDAALSEQETQIIAGAIDLKDKTVRDCVQPLERVYSIDVERILDLPTLHELVHVGHSRIPVYEGSKEYIIGLLRVKHLIIINPAVPTTVRQQRIFPIPHVNADRPLYDMLQYFRTGRSHMVLVEEEPGGKVLGIVTLEDLIEELLQTEIRGEEEVVFLRSASGLMRTQSVRALRGASVKNLPALAKRSQSTRCMGIERKRSLDRDVANIKKAEEGSVPSSVPTTRCHEHVSINEETPLLPVDNKSNTSAAPAPAGALGRQRAVSFFA